MGEVLSSGSLLSSATAAGQVRVRGHSHPSVPMRNQPGMVGFTVTGVRLVGAVIDEMAGLWRASFGPASACLGDVVVELLPPVGVDDEGDRVCVRLWVAARWGWWWVAHAPRDTTKWPLRIGPLVWMAHQRATDEHAARRSRSAARHTPGHRAPAENPPSRSSGRIGA